MIPIFKPYMPPNITTEIGNILYSGNLSFGKYGIEFEKKLKEYIGCDFLLTTSSYNTAMQIVLSLLDLKNGDEILTSPISCLASNQPFAVKGLKLIWSDVNPLTGSLCPESVKSKLTKNTKAIFHNHFCGYPGEIDEINKIGKEYGIPIIDDAIEAFGSQYKENKIGNVGTDLTVFSFQTVRLPNTIEGGAIAFKKKEDYEKALLIRDYGIDRSRFRITNGEINPNCDIKIEGFPGLMTELNSFIGIKQLDQLENLLLTQRNNANTWISKFHDNKDILSLIPSKYSNPNYWVFGLICKNKKRELDIFRKKGFYASSVHINNNIYSIFKNKEILLGVNDFVEHFLAIPCGWWFNNK